MVFVITSSTVGSITITSNVELEKTYEVGYPPPEQLSATTLYTNDLSGQQHNAAYVLPADATSITLASTFSESPGNAAVLVTMTELNQCSTRLRGDINE